MPVKAPSRNPAHCKPWSTLLRATCAAAALLVAAVACGGAQKRDHYQASLDQQQACCNKLSDPNERGLCLDQITTVDDPEVAASDVNQKTFHCMEKHFVCDPQTGQATQASKQAQLDCLNDLQ